MRCAIFYPADCYVILKAIKMKHGKRRWKFVVQCFVRGTHQQYEKVRSSDRIWILSVIGFMQHCRRNLKWHIKGMSNGITQEQERMESHLLFPAAIDVCTSELYLYRLPLKVKLEFQTKTVIVFFSNDISMTSVNELGPVSQHRDWLSAGLLELAEIFVIHAVSGAHLAFCSVGIEGSFSRLELKLSTHLHIEPRLNYVEFYLHIPYALPWDGANTLPTLPVVLQSLFQLCNTCISFVKFLDAVFFVNAVFLS